MSKNPLSGIVTFDKMIIKYGFYFTVVFFFTSTNVISAYRQKSCRSNFCLCQGIHSTTFCQVLPTVLQVSHQIFWFPLPHKTGRHN